MSTSRQLTAQKRSQHLEAMQEKLDLLVIGGGITGSGIALDAALRGLKVGLVDMQDFAAGTSSRSTKLIHGGLRYLKQGEINLVREVGQERAILHRNAPHLVRPEWMLLPLVKGGTYGKLTTSIGLWLYDRLAGVKQKERRIMLDKQQTLVREPLLKKEGLKGSGLYVEYRTDDARLTMEVLKTAVEKGAHAVNYAQVTDFLYDQDRIKGVVVKDTIADQQYHINAKKIVNAAGPWVDQLRETDNSLDAKHLHLTKGVHIVVDHEHFPLQQSVYFDVSDGRMVFAIPREGKTYIGTTDTDYVGDLREPPLSDEDVHYLVQAVNEMFPSVQLHVEDIESHWAGLRPLIHEEGKSPSELSRKDEIFHSPTGLITIAGGKLTGFRKMAERIVNVVVEQLAEEEGRNFPPCQTAEVPLSGGQLNEGQEWSMYVEKKVSEMERKGLNSSTAMILLHRYGTNVDYVLDFYEQQKTWPTSAVEPVDPLLQAELLYALEYEMVMHADDFFIRRTGEKYFNIESYLRKKEAVGELVDQYLSKEVYNM